MQVGHLARQRLLTGMRKTPEVAPVLGGKADAVEARFPGSWGIVFSSDLRAASDLIPLWTADALVSGLERSGQFSPDELLGLRACTSPVLCHWADHTGPDAPAPKRLSQLLARKRK